MPGPAQFRHLDYSGKARPQKYTAKGGGGGNFKLFPRQRAAHASKLQQELQIVQQEAERLRISHELAAYTEDVGINLEIIGEPDCPLRLDVLDAPKFGVTLKNAREIETQAADGTKQKTTVATVFVAHGKLTYLTKRVEDYANKQTDKGYPKQQEFVANIASIGLAAIESFWTSRHPLPALETETWWEVWIRAGSSSAKREHYERAVENEAERLGIAMKRDRLRLPEHTVFLLKTSRRTLASAVALLNFVSELRHPALTPAFFVEQTATDQHQWADDLKKRCVLPPEDAPAVCVLDTGVNRGHPLLADLLAESDHDTVREEWGKDDHVQNGHGTLMSGLAAYGDLTPMLIGDGQVRLTHRLESVKVLPRFGHNEPEHYGPITQSAMAKAEINAPLRRRVFALAVTATDAKDFTENGKPSAWSAALDSYAAGYLDDDGTKRLICVSAGNVGLKNATEYPSRNDLTSIEDPAQSWNALTIGACTDKDIATDEHGQVLADWTGIAPRGGLCPESTTSILWQTKDARHWPIKPDLVLEGGNLAKDASGFPSTFDSLSLLTTNADFRSRLFTTFSATSAATALAARMAATIQAAYPNFWPETVRALMVHSAEWTNEMVRGVRLNDKRAVANVLHRFGHGVPDVTRALASARNRATLICQDSLQPFEKRADGTLATRDMMLYRLPWPKALLQAHGEADLRLRVTLSYFIEPNPGSRAVTTKYRYAGCNLRFQVRTPTELSLAAFVARVSAAVSEEDRETYKSAPKDTTDGWLIGDDRRCRGSLHSDTWTGSAADLAQREHLIVYPVNGWWRLRPQHKRFNDRIRYTLVVSVESAGLDIDLYTPIETSVATEVVV